MKHDLVEFHDKPESFPHGVLRCLKCKTEFPLDCTGYAISDHAKVFKGGCMRLPDQRKMNRKAVAK